MSTTPADRFARIFANGSKPALPDPGLPHIADTELQRSQAVQAGSSQQFVFPSVPQVEPQFLRVKRQGARDIISGSDEEDDYVNALNSGAKPEMLHQSEYRGGRKTRKGADGELGVVKNARLNFNAALKDLSEGVEMRYLTDFESPDMKNDTKLPTKDEDDNPVTGHFCIFSLVAKFPYKYMKDPSDQVSQRFFASNKFYAREWDVYYLQSPATTYSQPLILLPLHQVEQLLKEIGASFKINVKLPPPPFTLSFFDDKTPQPVLLGKTRSRLEYDELQSSIPPTAPGHGVARGIASKKEKRAFEDFKIKCEMARTANKKGKTSKQEKKIKERFVALREGSSGLRRTQRYFGLRPEKEEIVAPSPSLSWEEQQNWEAELDAKSGAPRAPLDVAKLAPHPFEKNVVFVCVDVEANEHAHHQITEIGISTLDIHDIRDIPPGPGGENWIKQTRSRHFRIKERSHIRNKTFVHGNPDRFEFGDSESVALRDAADAVDRCFTFPFSQGFQHDGKNRLALAKEPSPQGLVDRRVVPCGHDVHTDIDYLSNLGSKIFRSSQSTDPSAAKHPILETIEEALDIAILYKVLKEEEQTRSLGSVMADLGRDAWGLHNGGNDARYTMECLIGLAIKARLRDDEKAKKQGEEKARVAKEVDEANKAWVAQGANPLASSKPRLFANTDSAEEAAALNAKFLDPAMTPATALGSAGPGRGRHYGSDDDLDEISDDDAEPAGKGGNDAWFDNLVKAADQKLNLGAADDDEDSEFEM